MTESSALVVEAFETLDAIEGLEDEWRTLEAAIPNATGFQSYDWCAAWLRAAAPAARVVTVREAGRLVMLWPLQIETFWGVRIARWIGEPMTQYGDALLAPNADGPRCQAAAETAMLGWRDVDLLAFTRLRADGVLGGAAAGASRAALHAPFVDIAGAPAHRHKSMERRARRLEARGPVFLKEAESPAARENGARRALEMKRAWLESHGFVSAGLSNSAVPDFIIALARAGFLRVHILCVGGDAAAVELGFFAGGAYRSLLGAFDARFAEGSPGHALTRQLIARCAEKGVDTYDFLAPADSYKTAFATGETAVNARYAPLNWRGRAAAFVFEELRPLAKRVYYGLAARGLFTKGRRETDGPPRAGAAPLRNPLLG